MITANEASKMAAEAESRDTSERAKWLAQLVPKEADRIVSKIEAAIQRATKSKSPQNRRYAAAHLDYKFSQEAVNLAAKRLTELGFKVEAHPYIFPVQW